MEFCIIGPTAGLERYATLSKTHLVLAHIKDGAYVEFYRKRRTDGDWIILDNGAYESAGIPDVYLVEAIRIYDPQVFVLPDYPLEPWKKSWHAAIHFLDAWSDQFPTVQWLYIPQSEEGDLHGFMESYSEAIDDPRITWLGIPRALAYAITDNPLARVDFARMVRKDRPSLKLHCFGMVNGDVHELPYLAQAGVTSIDSSAPIWRGWHRNYIDKQHSRIWWDENGTPVNFSSPFVDEPMRDDVIKHNLEACGVRIPTR